MRAPSIYTPLAWTRSNHASVYLEDNIRAAEPPSSASFFFIYYTLVEHLVVLSDKRCVPPSLIRPADTQSQVNEKKYFYKSYESVHGCMCACVFVFKKIYMYRFS